MVKEVTTAAMAAKAIEDANATEGSEGRVRIVF